MQGFGPISKNTTIVTVKQKSELWEYSTMQGVPV